MLDIYMEVDWFDFEPGEHAPDGSDKVSYEQGYRQALRDVKALLREKMGKPSAS